MSSLPRIFDFDTDVFEPTVAHDGRAPVRVYRAIGPADGSAYEWLDLVEIPVGADIGVHTHDDGDEEIYVILSGYGRMTLDGSRLDVGPGNVIVNRPGGSHGLCNTGDTPLRLVVVDAAARRRDSRSNKACAAADQPAAPCKESYMQKPPIYQMTCTRSRRYHVTMVEQLLHADNPALAEQLGQRQALLVTTPNVARLYGRELQALIDRHQLRAELLVLPCSEQQKTLAQVAWLCEQARQRGLDRTSVLVGVGGGVCTDIVSVAAAAIRRGIATIRVPTTLIGLIDAGIGLKGAVNFSGKKSFLGCFYPPEAVLIDPSFLRTLPQQFLRVGFAEIIKMALVRDAELFELVVNHGAALLESAFASPPAPARRVLWLSIQRMLEELEQNPYEDRTYQRLVDFGHTFSPLLEAAYDFTLHHGDAVAIDIALSATIAEELGLLAAGERARIIDVLRATGLPIHASRLSVTLAGEALREAVRHRGGAVNLVVPVGIGRATFVEDPDQVPGRVLEAAIARLASESATVSPLPPTAYAHAPVRRPAARTAPGDT